MLFVLLGYLLINLLFNLNLFWNQLLFDFSKVGGVYGEVQAYEWLTNKFYQLLISGQNPFGITKAMLYPFGFNLGLVDAGYGLFFPLFRPFLSAHQTMSILIALSLLMANIGMYLLLRELNFSKILSFIIGAAYGYMTFLMPRGGHLSYWCHFVFPWFYYFVISFFLAKDNKKKILNVISSSIFFVLTLWLNFYYFVMLLISLFSLLSFYFIFHNELFIKKLKENWFYLISTGGLIFIWLIPWLLSLYDIFIFDQVPKTNGWGGAIEFSSDLFNYFIPSEYGYLVTKYPFLLKPFSLFLKLYTPNARLIFENFTYPGIIILLSFFILIIFYKKIKKETIKQIWPFLFTSIVFLILTLGPFLHVFGHWTLTVDEGVKIVIPLPYIILHYIPFLNNIRVPGRLIVGFIFFAYIVSAFVITDLLKNKSNRFKVIFLSILFLIFFLDNRYFVSSKPPFQIKYPNKIYSYIKNDREFSTVLEIPFTVRDGFTYFGNGDAFQMIIGEAIHGKPVLGGYTGRIADYKKNYYKDNPFFGYLGRLIDSDLLNNPSIEKSDLINWKNIDLEKSKDTINFLDLKYIINDDSMSYSSSISALLNDLGFEKKITDYKYSLWVRPIEKKEYTKIQISNRLDTTLLGLGWNTPEGLFRWVERKSSIMFKIYKKRNLNLNFKAASFYQKQNVTVYLNKKKVKTLPITTEYKNYSVFLGNNFNQGINTIYFIFEKNFRPFDVIPGSLDKRRLSGQFTETYLSEAK